MADIKDFQCTYHNLTGISSEVTKGLGVSFPDAYLHHHTMAKLSKALKEYDGVPFCELPFCHTVEAEAMGGRINYGNENVGPRAKEYICVSSEEILDLPEIDFTTGRIHEVLLACMELKEQGEDVVLQVSGPFTILNVLIDIQYVFKAMRKKPELMKKVFWKLGNQILRFMEEACRYGVDMISYADSAGGVSILGPKMAEQVVEDFTYDFLRKADKIVGENTLILLCPKTTLALIGTGKARFRDIMLPAPEGYGEACMQMKGKIRFAGQMCMKNRDYRLENGIFKAVELEERMEAVN